MLESESKQQLKSSVISGGSILFCVICRTYSQIFPTKAPHGNPITDYKQKKRKKKNSKLFCKYLLGILVGFP